VKLGQLPRIEHLYGAVFFCFTFLIILLLTAQANIDAFRGRLYLHLFESGMPEKKFLKVNLLYLEEGEGRVAPEI